MSNAVQRGAIAGLITGALALASLLALAMHCLPLRISAVMPMPWLVLRRSGVRRARVSGFPGESVDE
jgi:hypothetical protein